MQSGEPPSSRNSRRTYDGSRRQADAVARRRRVIDAAEQLFLSQGYGATSIAEIADRADVSPQMIYASFTSKAGLLAKLADVVVAGDDAALEGDDGPLVRDRYAHIEQLRSPDLHVRLAAMAWFAAQAHGGAAHVLRLIDSVAGADAGVAELQERLLAGLRDDIALSVAAFPPEQLRSGLDLDSVTTLLYLLLGWRGYVALVLESGWTQERYVRHMSESLITLLLPDRA